MNCNDIIKMGCMYHNKLTKGVSFISYKTNDNVGNLLGTIQAIRKGIH